MNIGFVNSVIDFDRLLSFLGVAMGEVSTILSYFKVAGVQ